MIEIVFWVAVFSIVYPYAVYPPIAYLLGLISPRQVVTQTWTPMVTVLIPAYNEADCIGATLENKLDQNYPREKVQIIVISDGSTDDTDNIVRTFEDRGIQLIRREGREGKAAGLNDAVQYAVGEILVFSDANSIFHPDATRYLVENFADRDVGYVTGYLDFLGENHNLIDAGIGLYNQYEKFLREAETRIGSIIGVNGGVSAIRRELYCNIPSSLITDFVLPLSVIAGGHRVVFDSRVVSHEAANTELRSEFRMRIRVTLRAMQGLVYMRRLLNPFRYPLVSFCILSHKIVRYMGFLFMAVALATNVWLVHDWLGYKILLSLQLTGYSLALIGLVPNLPRLVRLVSAGPCYLVMSNTAFGLAFLKLIRGDTMATWKPRAG